MAGSLRRIREALECSAGEEIAHTHDAEGEGRAKRISVTGAIMLGVLDALEGRIAAVEAERDAIKLNDAMASDCLAMIASTLDALGCCHGHADSGGTPPMNYNDWIRCVVAKRERENAKLRAALEKAAAMHTAVHSYCPLDPYPVIRESAKRRLLEAARVFAIAAREALGVSDG